MRIVFLDVDTLRPDHLGCYGYHRNTSPNIDRIAAEGLRFTNYYATDVPCLPSRSALTTGQFGIHNGCFNHGGLHADLPPEGPDRSFRRRLENDGFFGTFRRAGYYTVSISPFGERHSAWHWYAGLNEMHNPVGKGGGERADELEPTVMDWLDRNGRRDHWMLHINLWDPHTHYRTPESYGNPFADDPPPAWMTQETLDANRAAYGPHSALDHPSLGRGGRVPEQIRTLDDYKMWIDGYDVGIRFADDMIGRVLAKLEELGILDDTAIIFSTDHGENQGELCVYGDHQTADQITCRLPMLIRWPGVTRPGSVDDGLHYQIDLLPTLADIFGIERPTQWRWDGESYVDAIRRPGSGGRDYLVVSQMAWACQRSVRWKNWMLIRTYHTGLKPYPPVMLFDVDSDPHELDDLTDRRPEVVHEGLALLERWHTEQMAVSASPVDPLQNVLREGGPFHTRNMLGRYCQRLRETGRGHHAETLEAMYGQTNRS